MPASKTLYVFADDTGDNRFDNESSTYFAIAAFPGSEVYLTFVDKRKANPARGTFQAGMSQVKRKV